MVCSKCKSADHNVAKCTAVPEKVEILIPEEDGKKLVELVRTVKRVGNELKKGRKEGVYQNAICHELQDMGVKYTREEVMPITYKGRFVGEERLDIVLNSYLDVIFELKSVASEIKAENHWQVLSYMNYKNYKYGFVVNYNQSHAKGLMIDILVRQDEKMYLLDLDEGTGIELEDYSY